MEGTWWDFGHVFPSRVQLGGGRGEEERRDGCFAVRNEEQ